MPNRRLDIIWNISLVCPWDCKFCCTDAVHVSSRNNNIIVRENSLKNIAVVERGLESGFKVKYKDVNPTKYDLALISRQLAGKEPSYEQKIRILNNLKGYDVKIDFAGGDPLACHENYLVIKAASKIFGKESISITSTGAFVKKYGVQEISSFIGEYEFTYDEPADSPQDSRPVGYNSSNLKIARKFSSLGVRTKAQLPIHFGNISNNKVEQIYSDLCEAGISEILLMRTFPVGRGEEYLRENALTKAELVGAIKCFKAVENKTKTKVRLQCALKHLFEYDAGHNPCDLMHESFGINFMGDLLLSAWANNAKGLPLSEDFVLGNLCTQSFAEISETNKFQRYKKRLDENFGHCKIFSYVASTEKNEDSIFQKNDPLYARV